MSGFLLHLNREQIKMRRLLLMRSVCLDARCSGELILHITEVLLCVQPCIPCICGCNGRMRGWVNEGLPSAQTHRCTHIHWWTQPAPSSNTLSRLLDVENAGSSVMEQTMGARATVMDPHLHKTCSLFPYLHTYSGRMTEAVPRR